MESGDVDKVAPSLMRLSSAGEWHRSREECHRSRELGLGIPEIA